MKKLFFPLGIFSLMFCVACGSNGPGPIIIPKGNFSNASLKGQYVYQLSGFDSLSCAIPCPYYEAGVFVADGNGNLTNVSDDFSEGSPTPTVGTGTYKINNDGTGTLALPSNIFGAVNLAVTMVGPSVSSSGGSSKAYLSEADPGLNSSGIAEQQDTTAISTPPTGTFVFRQHTANTSQAFNLSTASVGVFTVSNTGGTVTGNEDVNRGGTFNNGTANPLTLTSGLFNSPNSLGRGTGSFTDSFNITFSFIYYVVDANNVRFLSMSSSDLGIGRAEMQNAPALSGSYAFGGRGDTVNNGINAVDTVGAFTASGGAITSGAIDAVEDGTPLSATITGGSYTTPGANGRATLTLNTSSGSHQATLWMVSPARGFFLITNDANAVEDGTLDQQSGTFTNATMNGQFAFMMDGFDTTQFLDRVGTLQWDGTSKLTLNEFVNNGSGAVGPIPLSGTYTVSSNGRAVGTGLSNLSNNLVFYLISGNDAYVLQNDSGVQINGMISKQPKP